MVQWFKLKSLLQASGETTNWDPLKDNRVDSRGLSQEEKCYESKVIR